MTMPYVHLGFALAQLAHGHNQLHEALRLAKAQGYGPDWIAAIEKAIADNQATHLHIGNIRDLIGSPHALAVKLAVEKEGTT